jgi:DNA-binding CsgD family transcriptional regulator
LKRLGHVPSLYPALRPGIGQLTHSGRDAVGATDDNAGVGVDTRLSDGTSALGQGRWSEARSAFEAVLATGPHAEALDGLGQALWWLGEPRRSNELREQAYTRFRRAGDAAKAVQAALGVAITYEANFGNNQAATGWIARAGRLLDGDDDPLGPWVWATRAYVTPDPASAIALYERSLAAARTTRDVDLELSSLSGLGERMVLAGDVAAGMSLIDEAMAGTLGGEYTRLDTVVYTSCDMLVACDLAHDLGRAARWCQVADGFIRDYGCPFLYARCRTIYGGLLITAGRWSDAERELSAAITMSDGAGPAMAADAHAKLADLRLRQGRLEEAASLLSGHEDQSRAQLAAAAVRLARGDAAGAIAVLERRLAREHVGMAPVLALLVRAHLGLGDVDTAHQVTGTLAALAREQRSTYAQALAEASAGQVCFARNDIDEGAARLEAALCLFVALDMPHETARARLELARGLAESRPTVAISEAEAALSTLDRIGAVADADEAAALLRALGVTPKSSRSGAGELTGRERQVLVLVAQGLTNPEIAARLHISRKTAAHHVSNVLSKLGVRNRTEAVGRLPPPSGAHGQVS